MKVGVPCEVFDLETDIALEHPAYPETKGVWVSEMSCLDVVKKHHELVLAVFEPHPEYLEQEEDVGMFGVIELYSLFLVVVDNGWVELRG